MEITVMMTAFVSLNPTPEVAGTWDMDKRRPEKFSDHYPERCWADYGVVKDAIFYAPPTGNTWFWQFALGDSDMHKVEIPKDKVIITSNKQWAGDLKSLGYTVKIRKVVETLV
jgi:hypothetical protein